MPSWLVASRMPVRWRASSAIAPPCCPASASGSSWLRRADIAANSAPTKKALAARRSTVTRIVVTRRPSPDHRTRHPAGIRRGVPGVGGAHLVVVALVGRRASRALQAHPVDAVAVHVDDPGGPPVGLDGVADRRHPAQRRHDPAADGLVRRAVGDARTHPAAHLVGTPQPGDGPRAVGQAAAGGLRAVVLVADLADDLLDEVLQRDDTRGAAVLVDDDGELHPALAQLEEQRVESQGLGDEHGLHHERRHGHVAAAAERHGDGLLDVHDAVDVVPVGADDGEARVTGDAAPARRGRPRSRCARSTSPASAGVMTSAAVWSAKPRDAVTSRAVPRPRVPASADVRTSDASSAGLRAAESSSCGSMPSATQRAVGDPVEQGDHRLHRDAEPAHRRRPRPSRWRGAARPRGSWAPSRRRSSRTPSR